MRDAVENLKARPKEERTAVASGIAIAVVVVLLAVWGFVFFQKISRAPSTSPTAGTIENTGEFQNFQQATDAFTESYNSASAELQRIREEAEALRGQQDSESAATENTGAPATDTSPQPAADEGGEPTESAFDVQ